MTDVFVSAAISNTSDVTAAPSRDTFSGCVVVVISEIVATVEPHASCLFDTTLTFSAVPARETFASAEVENITEISAPLTRDTFTAALIEAAVSMSAWAHWITEIYMLYDALLEKLNLTKHYRMTVSLSKNDVPPRRGRDYHVSLCGKRV